MSDEDDHTVLNDCVPRSADGIRCPVCKVGYADRVDVTAEEDKEHGCGRARCCARAFVCANCGARLVGAAEAPEME